MGNKFIFIIDNGHGGVINGVPQTAGKRSPDFGKGILYEGVSNRRLSKKVMNSLNEESIPAVLLVSELEDISLKERVNRVNAIVKAAPKGYQVILISIHSDGYTKESANGWSAYTSKGDTKSDKVAAILYKHAKLSGYKIREDYSDGDIDKEANFYILRKTKCLAVLVENLFMTNRKDYKELKSCSGQRKLSGIIINTIKEITQNGL